MDRRTFLIETVRKGSVLLILPVGWSVVGCGGGSSPTPANVPVQVTAGLRFTSDNSGGHTHDFSIAMDSLVNPPAAGISGPTTVTLDHSHTVALTMDELASIEAGQAVSKQTTIVDGHQHTFKFSLSTAESTETPPTTTAAASTGAEG